MKTTTKALRGTIGLGSRINEDHPQGPTASSNTKRKSKGDNKLGANQTSHRSIRSPFPFKTTPTGVGLTAFEHNGENEADPSLDEGDGSRRRRRNVPESRVIPL